MEKNKIKESIQATKQEFEKSFMEGGFYKKQTQDDQHLQQIIDCLPMKAKMKVLDLGTGTGYLAFSLASQYPDIEVVGIDIVEQTLRMNQERAKLEGLSNLTFVSYDGVEFPFESSSFDLIVTRYALHHFPEIEQTFEEMKRVLKNTGHLFLSDPAPMDCDHERFVDAYMQMKKDGHIKFYTQDEWKEIANLYELKFVDGFETTIRFPRKKETALEFDDIISRHDETVIKGYEVEVVGDEIWITEKVNNLLFKKMK